MWKWQEKRSERAATAAESREGNWKRWKLSCARHFFSTSFFLNIPASWPFFSSVCARRWHSRRPCIRKRVRVWFALGCPVAAADAETMFSRLLPLAYITLREKKKRWKAFLLYFVPAAGCDAAGISHFLYSTDISHIKLSRLYSSNADRSLYLFPSPPAS